MSVERLGVTVIPGAGWRASDIRNVARAAEDAGFEAIFTTEVNNDALATAQLMGSATAVLDGWVAAARDPEDHSVGLPRHGRADRR